jgi:biopolymer transport protein ExbD
MKNRRQQSDGPEPVLPITPMLDMAFQLLAFFILIYRPSDLEGQMQLALPSQNAAAAHRKEQVDPSAASDPNATLEVPSDVTVIVKTQNDGVNNGLISALTVQDRAGPSEIRPATPEQSPIDALMKHLQRIKETVDNKTALKLQADSRLKWGSVVQVMDACRKAGFENISFVPPPDSVLNAQ